MKIKGVNQEDFVNYKLPSMYLATSFCTFKCEKECGIECCQNSLLADPSTIPIEVSDDSIIERYIQNPITKSIVFGGLEPLDQFDELMEFIDRLRNHYKVMDDVVIYTGYKYESWKDVKYIPDLCDNYNELSNDCLNTLIGHNRRIKQLLNVIA